MYQSIDPLVLGKTLFFLFIMFIYCFSFKDLTINPTPLLAVINDDTAVLNCSASGNPPPTVHWIFHGSNITNNTKYIITNGVLTLLNVELNDTGDYYCTASNVYRSLSGKIELKVQGNSTL